MEPVSPAAALVGNLQAGALDDPLDVSGQMFALQVHRQRLSGRDTYGVRMQLQNHSI